MLFIATLHMRPCPFVYQVKAVPIYSLSVMAFLNIAGLRGKLIGLGLVFSGSAISCHGLQMIRLLPWELGPF